MATFGDIKISTINGGPLSGMRNAVINGNFAINQRGVSGTVTLAAGAYGHDRFKAGAGGCTYTFATSENVTTLTITAGTLIQVIEGANLLTDTYTLTFTGTAQGKIGAGSFGASGVTGSVTGGTNLNVEFNTGTVSLVQLERGSVATPFEFRSIGQELALCQRYFQIFKGSSVYMARMSAGMAWSTTNTANHNVPFVVSMRAAPTLTQSGLRLYSPDLGGRTATVVLAANATDHGAGLDTSASSGLVVGNVWWIAGTNTSSFAAFSSEL